MEDKRCENCRHKEDTCLKWDCHPWETAKHWQPNYQTLESQLQQLENENKALREYQEYGPALTEEIVNVKAQLSAANEELAEYVTEIGEFRKIIQEFVLWGPMTKSDRDYFINEFQKLLSTPAPVDEEKVVLKEALRLSCEDIDCEACPIQTECHKTYIDDHKVCVGLLPDYYIKEARSRIEEGEKLEDKHCRTCSYTACYPDYGDCEKCSSKESCHCVDCNEFSNWSSGNLIKGDELMKVYKVSTSYQYCVYEHFEDVTEELESLLDLGKKITIEELEMTQEEFNNLPEFTGW